MSLDLTVGLVRILTPDGKTAGTGFLVHESGLIATCAHVVWPRPMRERGYPRPDAVRVIFHATGEEQTARVVEEWWRDPDAEDVAILRLEGPLPEGVIPLPLGSSQHSRGHDFSSWGYRLSEAFPKGLAAEGKIQARVRYGNRDALQLLTSQIDSGMSGAPLWDVQGRRVVGMVNAFWETRRHQDAWLALAVPAETLREACPLLSLSDLCPYRGLEAFTEADAEFFFGRSRAVEHLVGRLRQEPRFLAVLGPSGSGKSSLVQAGLIPRLRQGAVPGSDRWAFILTRPARNPFGELEARGLEGASQGLVEAVRNWRNRHPEAERLILVVDPFEELLVDCPDEVCRAFVAGLADLLNSPLPVTVVLVMRDDFYSRFVREARPLVEWLERGLANVPLALEQEDLRAIVEEPARAVGLALEEGLTDAILREAMGAAPEGTPGTVLPLLEFALTRLWERREEGMLTHAAYRAIGGVTGALTGWADGVFSRMNEEERRLARRVLTDLVHLGDESRNVPDSRRRRTLEELIRREEEREAVHRVVRLLADARLVVTGRDLPTGRETVELIHDALLREWGQLRGWLQEDRRFLAWQQGLEGRLEEWQAREQDPDLLLRGASLTEALDWLSRRGDEVAPQARDFIRRSQEHAEAQRRARERLRRRITLGLTAGLVIALILASLALWQWRRAEEQRKVALLRQLASQAQYMWRLPRSNTERLIASLLAMEVLKRAPSVEAHDVLQGVLFTWPRIRVIHHRGPVQDVLFSPDSRFLATASWDGTVALVETATSRELARIRHKGCDTLVSPQCLEVAFSPDGRFLATAGWDGTAALVEAATGREVARIRHENKVWEVAFSPDGRFLATASEDGTAALVETATGRELARIHHEDMVESVAFSPDGRFLATASLDGTAALVEAATGREVARIRHGGPVVAIAFSPDGRFLATASWDGTAALVEAATGRELARIRHEDLVEKVAFSPDSRFLATASLDDTAALVEAATGREVARIRHGVVMAIALSPDGLLLAIRSAANTVALVEAATGWEVARIRHENWVRVVAFSPDGRFLATASEDGTVVLVEAATGQEVARICHEHSVMAIAFSPEGRFLATASLDGTAALVEAAKGRERARIRHEDRVWEVAFSPDGRFLATASLDDTAALVEAATGRERARIRHENWVREVAFSPDGRFLATASGDGTAALVEAATGRELARIRHEDRVWEVAFSPDGRFLATASGDGTAALVEAATGRELARIRHEGWVREVAFSPDGRFLATASLDGTAALVETATGRELARIRHEDWVGSVAFSPDGRFLATRSADNAVALVEAATGRERARIRHEDRVWEVAFSPDGRFLATVSEDDTAALVETATGRELARIRHEGGVGAIVFSPDGRFLATASRDGTAALVETATGRELARIRHEDWVREVAFSPDGRFLVTAGGPDVYILPLNQDELFARVCERLLRNLTREEWNRYIGPEEPYRPTCPNLPVPGD